MRATIRAPSSPCTSALMLAGFAGLTLAAGMAALYLWQERRLKRHERRVLRVRVPPLDALDRLAARALASLACYRSGSASVLAQLERDDLDAAMVVTSRSGRVYAALLVLRHEGLRGRRAALAEPRRLRARRVVLPLTHFAS